MRATGVGCTPRGFGITGRGVVSHTHMPLLVLPLLVRFLCVTLAPAPRPSMLCSTPTYKKLPSRWLRCRAKVRGVASRLHKVACEGGRCRCCCGVQGAARCRRGHRQRSHLEEHLNKPVPPCALPSSPQPAASLASIRLSPGGASSVRLSLFGRPSSVQLTPRSPKPPSSARLGRPASTQLSPVSFELQLTPIATRPSSSLGAQRSASGQPKPPSSAHLSQRSPRNQLQE